VCIRFKVEGGLAYFPGLASPMTLEVEELPPQEAKAVKALVRASHFFQQPSQEAPRGADLQTYVLTVEDAGQSHTVMLCDPISDPELRALVEYLQSKR